MRVFGGAHHEDSRRDSEQTDLPPDVRLESYHALDVVVEALVACDKSAL